MGGRSRIHTHVFPRPSLAPSAMTQHARAKESWSVKTPQQPPPPGQSPQAPLSAQGRRVPITEAPAHCPSFCPNQLPMPSLVPSLPCGSTSSCCSKALEERTTQILSSPGPGPRGEGRGSAAGVTTAHGTGHSSGCRVTCGQQVAPVHSQACLVRGLGVTRGQ